MIHILLGLTGSLLVVAYWAYCRRAALVHQERLASLIADYFEQDDVSDPDKDAAYWTYKMARTWLFVPVMTVISPIAILVGIVAGGIESKMEQIHADTRRNDIMDAALKMYMTRNPLTAALFMTATAVIIGIFIPVGILFNRLKSFPSATAVYSAIANSASHQPSRHHAH